jgi:D-xylonolactonase
MPEATVVAEFGELCGECPVWDAERSSLEWIDCVRGSLYQVQWPSRKASLVRSGLSINGFRRNRMGGYVITNSKGVWLWDGTDQYSPVVSEVAGLPCQANDCIADAAGRFLTATYYYDPGNDYRLGSLISIERDGVARVLDQGFHLANGMGFSPGMDRLYFADSAARIIFSYEYDLQTGSVRDKKVFVQVPAEEGLPDGLAVDADGCIWSAQWYGGCVVRYDPSGKVLQRLRVPAKQSSSVAFGGPDLTDIFITSAAQSEPMPIMPPGYDPVSGNFGGALYHANLGIAGQPQLLADIRLA